MNQEIILRSIFSKHSKISEKDWAAIFAISKLIELKKGECFIKAGEIKDDLGIIVTGCMRYFYLKDGVEITGEFWQENEIVGAYEGCILQEPSTLYIEAIEKTQIITLSYGDLKLLSNKIEGLDKALIALLENFIVESQRRIASYITETAEERYLRLREEMPGIEFRVNQKYIASFVGVTPVTLSRIRARLSKNG